MKQRRKSGSVSELQDALPILEAQFEAAHEAAERRLAPALKQVQDQIQHLERSWFPILRWYKLRFCLPPLVARVEWLQSEAKRLAAPSFKIYSTSESELNQLRANPEPAINQRVASHTAKLARLEGVTASSEYAGTIGELEMAKYLAAELSDDYHVFHDINIDMGRWVYTEGTHRQTAQIDHLVVGPSGVFVIECKLWSHWFAKAGNYDDPYEQVHWAGKLCHFKLTGEVGQKIRVRQIIATSRKLPPKPANDYTKVLPPERVSGYIRRMKIELEQPILESIVAILNHCC